MSNVRWKKKSKNCLLIWYLTLFFDEFSISFFSLVFATKKPVYKINSPYYLKRQNKKTKDLLVFELNFQVLKSFTPRITQAFVTVKKIFTNLLKFSSSLQTPPPPPPPPPKKHNCLDKYSRTSVYRPSIIGISNYPTSNLLSHIRLNLLL